MHIRSKNVAKKSTEMLSNQSGIFGRFTLTLISDKVALA